MHACTRPYGSSELFEVKSTQNAQDDNESSAAIPRVFVQIGRSGWLSTYFLYEYILSIAQYYTLSFTMQCYYNNVTYLCIVMRAVVEVDYTLGV